MSNVVLDKETFSRRLKKLYQNWKVISQYCIFRLIYQNFNEIVPLSISHYINLSDFYAIKIISFCHIEILNFPLFYLSIIVRNQNIITMTLCKSVIVSCQLLDLMRKSCIVNQQHFK